MSIIITSDLPDTTNRFQVWINEGAFMYEPWLQDNQTELSHRYDAVPPEIQVAFAEELLERSRKNAEKDISPDEFRMIVNFVRLRK